LFGQGFSFTGKEILVLDQDFLSHTRNFLWEIGFSISNIGTRKEERDRQKIEKFEQKPGISYNI
jgi:hypothetical protein